MPTPTTPPLTPPTTGTPDDGMAIALARIAEEAERQTGELDLSGLGLERLPDALFELTHLRKLDLSFSMEQLFSTLPNQTDADDQRCESLAELEELSLRASWLWGLSFVRRFPHLRFLDCSGTQVDDITPVAGLTNLQSLVCFGTQVDDIAPIAGIANLQSLDCSSTQVDDLAPLASLTNLQSLDCSDTQVDDLAPVAGLAKLQYLDCSDCNLRSFPVELLNRPSLRELRLHETTIPGIPPTGILSDSPYDNCLDRFRAHVADLADGEEEIPDVKLLILGNGCAGKTQIARWLADEPFNPDWDSTHGIRVVPALPARDDRPMRLRVWDFGGQDVYHGTHALFLHSPAVILLVWSADAEERDTHEHDGQTFRNHPLPYWVELVRRQAHPGSPLLIAQSKCDRPEEEVDPFPIDAEALKALPYRKRLHVSVKEGRGRAALEEALADAVRWMRDPNRLGFPRVGAGRLRVQRRLEAMIDADQALPPDQRQHRLMERADFDRLCAEEGGVSSPAHLLTYLDAIGVVFHRPGTFADRIVLDQGWALEAIYAVFERSGALPHIRAAGGRFTRPLLDRLVWRDHGEADQRLFLTMMASCGIAFTHREFRDEAGEVLDDLTEYIAPDHLPDRATLDAELAASWDADAPTATARFDHAFLHEGLIRTIMADIGGQAGPNALYWKGGLQGFEAGTGSRFRIEQTMTGPWRGAILVSAQRGRAAELLNAVVLRVERAQDRLGLRPIGVERSVPEERRQEEERAMTFTQEKPRETEWFVSYAWGDDTPEGRERDKVVNDLCATAEAAGRHVIRDKDVLGPGDSISRFMRRLGAANRVFVILSDKYLRSPHCMFELSEIWRTSRQEGDAVMDRLRVYALPGTKVWTDIDWTDWAIYWKSQHDALDARAREHGAGILGQHGNARLRQMQGFYTSVTDMLATIADRVQDSTIEDLARRALRDENDDAS